MQQKFAVAACATSTMVISATANQARLPVSSTCVSSATRYSDYANEIEPGVPEGANNSGVHRAPS
jgi:hypothetical protein